MITIIYLNPVSQRIAETLRHELRDAVSIPYKAFGIDDFTSSEGLIFIGALGICVRAIAPMVKDKYTDPAVVCVDTDGINAISVMSGHIGGANDLCRKVARIIGARPVITTQSDNCGLWALDTLASEFGWRPEATKEEMNRAIVSLVNGKPIGLLLEVKDRGTDYLERSLPPNVRIIKDTVDIGDIKLLIAVTYKVLEVPIPVVYYRPRVLNLGLGCRRGCNPSGVKGYIHANLTSHRLSFLSVKSLSTIDLKRDEALVAELSSQPEIDTVNIYSADDLKDIPVPNPSEKVKEVTGVWGVAESCAIAASDGGSLLLEKQKGKLAEDSDFTFAVSIDRGVKRGGHIEIVGAGPGDPELISVRGKRFLEEADLILYAGSLVPERLTHYAKQGCVVRSSASMNLEEQFKLMKAFYDRDMLVVRLHTGDPCIYGAIQEQMAFFDRYAMSYHITPGISSFQAAAAVLRSQFTIPEKVQTIILTRGEGRTPMPEKEQLHKLAQSQSTMCIYLSAGIVDEVQRQLLMAYPPETPVAACYKLTWPEEKIYRGELKDLAKLVHDNKLTLTTLLVVGEAIDNREGVSHLYNDNFKHLFRR
ncbi:MAG: precorrin-4 C(11)-methyltransferase [Muribaculaceae bacterium]|nr:precorrin-4 C(11)-methyltransferase [Muribaculaceae bacterium]